MVICWSTIACLTGHWSPITYMVIGFPLLYVLLAYIIYCKEINKLYKIHELMFVDIIYFNTAYNCQELHATIYKTLNINSRQCSVHNWTPHTSKNWIFLKYRPYLFYYFITLSIYRALQIIRHASHDCLLTKFEWTFVLRAVNKYCSYTLFTCM